MLYKKSYSFSEFKEVYYAPQDIPSYLKYIPPATMIAYINCMSTSSYGYTDSADLSSVANEIIDMVLLFGRYGCLGIGAKCMIENMIQGANLREATAEGIQYFIFYILLMLYPRLFSMIKF